MQEESKLLAEEPLVPLEQPLTVVAKETATRNEATGEEKFFECHDDGEKTFVGDVVEEQLKVVADDLPVVSPDENVSSLDSIKIESNEEIKEENHAFSTGSKLEKIEEDVESLSKENASTEGTISCDVPSSPAPSVTGTVNSDDDDGVVEEHNTPLPFSIIEKLEALKEIDTPDKGSKPVEKDLLDAVFERAELFLCAACNSNTAEEVETGKGDRDLLDDVFENVDIFENASRVVTNLRSSPDRRKTISMIPEHDVLDDFFESTEQIIRNLSDTPFKSKSDTRTKKSEPYRPDLLDLFFESAEKISVSQSNNISPVEEDAEAEAMEVIPSKAREESSQEGMSSHQPDLLDQFFESAENLVQRSCSETKTVEYATA